MKNKGSYIDRFLEASLLSSAELSQLDALLRADEEAIPGPAEAPQTDGAVPSDKIPPEQCPAEVRPPPPDAVLRALDGTDLEIGTDLSFKDLLSLRERGAQAARCTSFRSRT